MINPWNIAYIGLGSNMGDKIKNCTEAIHKIHLHPLCQVLRVSSFYETEPLTKTKPCEGGWFVNAALKMRTRLNVVKLLQMFQALEVELGRNPLHEKWSPRPMDLDILFFGDEIIKTGPLKVPHPELHKRKFVLEPLAEIAPDLLHPIKGKKITELLEELEDNKKVTPLFRFYLSQNNSKHREQIQLT